MDTVLGTPAITLGVPSEAAEVFGPLKAILGVISAVYTQYEVCLQLLLGILPDNCLQETVAVRNKINNLLSRIAVLEVLLATPAGDVAEKKCWNELLLYAIPPCPDLVLIFSQKTQGDCEPIAVAEGKVKPAAVCRPCSR